MLIVLCKKKEKSNACLKFQKPPQWFIYNKYSADQLIMLLYCVCDFNLSKRVTPIFVFHVNSFAICSHKYVVMRRCTFNKVSR